MTKLTLDQVRHLARLARLTLTPEEENRFCKELTDILRYVETLQEVNTDNVQPTSQVTGLCNVFRFDCLPSGEKKDDAQTLLRPAGPACRQAGSPTPDELLSCSPLPIVEHQIQTPSAHG